MTDKLDLVSVVVLDRPIEFKTFNDVQLALVRRMQLVMESAVKVLPQDPQPDEEPTEQQKEAIRTGLSAASQFLTMIENLAADPMDRQWLVEQMLAGNLELAQIAEFVKVMVPADKQPKQVPARKATRAK